MKRITVLLVLASLMFVSNVFAADPTVTASISGKGEYSFTYEMVKEKGMDDLTYMKLGDGDKAKIGITAEKTLDTGTALKLVGQVEIKPDGSLGAGDRFLQITSGATTWRVITPDAPDCFSKGLDIYLPEAGPGKYENKGWVKDRGFSVKYAAGSMTLTTTVRYQGGNEFGIRPHVQMSAGPATIKLAGEYYMKKPENTDLEETTTAFGGGAHVETKVSIATIGVAGGYSSTGGKNEKGTTPSDKDAVSKMTGVVYAKLAVGPGTAGVAALYTQEKNDDASPKTDKTNLSVYGGYELPNFIAQKLTLKLGVGMSQAGADLDKDITGGKLALAYEF